MDVCDCKFEGGCGDMRKMRVFGIGIIGIVFLFLVVACGKSELVIQTMEIAQTGTSTIVPTKTVIPSITPTLRPTYEIIQEEDLFEIVDLKDQQTIRSVNNYDDYSGLVLKFMSEQNGYQFELVNAKSPFDKAIERIEGLVSIFRVSPDNKKVLYRSQGKYFLQDFSTEQIIGIPWNYGWRDSITGWVNNDRLRIVYYDEEILSHLIL